MAISRIIERKVTETPKVKIELTLDPLDYETLLRIIEMKSPEDDVRYLMEICEHIKNEEYDEINLSGFPTDSDLTEAIVLDRILKSILPQLRG